MHEVTHSSEYLLLAKEAPTITTGAGNADQGHEITARLYAIVDAQRVSDMYINIMSRRETERGRQLMQCMAQKWWLSVHARMVLFVCCDTRIQLLITSPISHLASTIVVSK